MTRWFGILFFSVALACSCIVFGRQLSDERHLTDWRNGYSEGWRARQSRTEAEYTTMRAIGLCRYADLACGVQHAKR